MVLGTLQVVYKRHSWSDPGPRFLAASLALNIERKRGQFPDRDSKWGRLCRPSAEGPHQRLGC